MHLFTPGLMLMAPLVVPLLVTACQTSPDQEPSAPRIVAEEIGGALGQADIFLLDVRQPSELEELGTVEGYTNIPIDVLVDRLDELPKDRPILTA